MRLIPPFHLSLSAESVYLNVAIVPCRNMSFHTHNLYGIFFGGVPLQIAEFSRLEEMLIECS